MALKRTFFLIVFFSIFAIQQIQAEETDQFTLPPTEMLDVGPLASNRLYDVLQKVVSRTNAEIRMLLPKAQHSRYAAKQLAARKDDVYLANLVYEHSGPGFPRWFRRLPKTSQSIFYKELPWKTVYWLVFSQSPLFLIGLAPTVNMYGYHFGTDKLNHFFMMGHTYYRINKYLLAHGKSAEQAHSLLVLYGKFLELTYLGVLANGVYSNGDLAANYAGWKFYTNLAHPVKIGTRTLLPILVLNGNTWKFSKHVTPDNLLKPFISNHLNEAYNPCRYTFMRGQIRRQIRKRCDDWKTRMGLTPEIVQAKLEEARLWHGESYGHWLPPHEAVTLNACFGGQ
ncbi:Uncharacterised protein [Legionella wadsworthii]|uniref:Uncharacterized protein n=1 Tax=Legionella wadsworthii TaxID=28088 RepID=A0A378LNK1_9GAMM|nr:hypothetical protein [Legionella wadsworthii]STY28257.1 Uncharacterised protein [Legionella wadsworthii]